MMRPFLVKGIHRTWKELWECLKSRGMLHKVVISKFNTIEGTDALTYTHVQSPKFEFFWLSSQTLLTNTMYNQ